MSALIIGKGTCASTRTPHPENPASDNLTNKPKWVILLVERDAAFAAEVNVLTNKTTSEHQCATHSREKYGSSKLQTDMNRSTNGSCLSQIQRHKTELKPGLHASHLAILVIIVRWVPVSLSCAFTLGQDIGFISVRWITPLSFCSVAATNRHSGAIFNSRKPIGGNTRRETNEKNHEF